MRERELDPSDPYVETARFGREVENFVTSPIGDFLLKRAHALAEEATATLIEKAHELDKDQIRDLQTDIYRGVSFQRWLGEAILEGHAAIEALKEGEHGG
jgi:hypothetical protein